MADGVPVAGTWRHAFIRNGDHFLTDLFVYADGLIDCWGLVTLEEFEEKLRCGWVATELPEGGRASAHDYASWKFAEPHVWITPEELVAEVKDTIDQLNGRPDSTQRCLAAVDAYLDDPTEHNRSVARAAYLAIPATQRRYALGDMDYKDGPLRVLVAGPGGETDACPGEKVGEDEYAAAVAYFEERAKWIAEASSRVPADGPATPHAPAVRIPHAYPHKPSQDPGKQGLRNDYPAPVDVDGVTYPSVDVAYWSMSVADPGARAAVTAAEERGAARRLAAEAARQDGWEQMRIAVMSRLLRAKYTQHPHVAEVLLGTGDATLLYDDADSPFWGDNGGRGRNWTGRLLELVRSELRATPAAPPRLGSTGGTVPADSSLPG